MQKKLWLIIGSLCWYLSFGWINSLYAKTYNEAYALEPTKIAVKLEQITFTPKIKDKPGKDQIYFDLTEYSNMSKPKEFRIPTEPKHWLVRKLDKLRKIILWQGTIGKSETKTLIISLMRHDLPPLDSDEPLGSVKLIVTNTKKLQFVWDQAGFNEPIKIYKIMDQGSARKVIFKLLNKQGEYRLQFKVKII